MFDESWNMPLDIANHNQTAKQSHDFKKRWLLVWLIFVIASIALGLLWHGSLLISDHGKVFRYTEDAPNAGERSYHCDLSFASFGANDECGVLVLHEQTLLAVYEPSTIIQTADGIRFSGTVKNHTQEDEIRPWARFGNRYIVLDPAPPVNTAEPLIPLQTTTAFNVSNTPQNNAIRVSQAFMSDGSLELTFEALISGLEPDMAYIAGILTAPTKETLQQVGNATKLHHQTEATIFAQYTIPASAWTVGEQYQCVCYWYAFSGNGSGLQLSEAFAFQLDPKPQQQPFATPSSTISVSPAQKPIPTPQATKHVSITTQPHAEPSAALFKLYGLQQRYFIHQLNAHQMQLFSILYDGLCSFQDEISLTNSYYSENDFQLVSFVLENDCPELIQLATDNSTHYSVKASNQDEVVSVRFSYAMDEPTFRTTFEALRKKLDSLSLLPGFSTDDFQRQLCIYRYLTENSYYDSTSDHCAYADGPFLYGYAKCTGYAKALSLALRYYGIPCLEIKGNTYQDGKISPTGHLWNIAKINGEWYQCDVTWDTPEREAGVPAPKDYFCYLNITDAQMYMARTLIKEDFPSMVIPICTATRDNYFNKIGALLTAHWREEVQVQLTKAYQNGDQQILMAFSSDALFNDALLSLHDAISEWSAKQKVGISFTQAYAVESRCICILSIVFD